MRNVTFLLALALVVGLASAGAVFERACPTDVEAKQYFSVDAYLGKWYEMQRYESEFELNYDCVQVRYELNDDQSVSVSNSAYNLFNSSTINALGRAVLSFPDEEVIQGKLNVSFFGAPNDRSNYWVLDTDYQTYSVVWSCEELEENLSEESFWVLSRTPTMTTDRDALFRIHNIMRRYIDRSQLRFTRQLDEQYVASWKSVPCK
ncbi:apolipoprotein D-like [Anopheles ziemanni]|uniref:apolipoprotein D-like n=1 Tax=Anopheles coustani TaxID=139045 RepID=UPI002659747F|nr:apolipoprotein D-like [Anopheles coustani]XP_058169883.1 apolipoprotein D-like [Anopheles ziemanni]